MLSGHPATPRTCRGMRRSTAPGPSSAFAGSISPTTRPAGPNKFSSTSTWTSAGEVVLLTGPSGCGKTTLLTLIGGLRTVESGEMRVLGHELHACDPAELGEIRRQIGFIFQLHNLLDFLTARQNVQMALQLHPDITREEMEERAGRMLEMVGLGR